MLSNRLRKKGFKQSNLYKWLSSISWVGEWSEIKLWLNTITHWILIFSTNVLRFNSKLRNWKQLFLVRLDYSKQSLIKSVHSQSIRILQYAGNTYVSAGADTYCFYFYLLPCFGFCLTWLSHETWGKQNLFIRSFLGIVMFFHLSCPLNRWRHSNARFQNVFRRKRRNYFQHPEKVTTNLEKG